MKKPSKNPLRQPEIIAWVKTRLHNPRLCSNKVLAAELGQMLNITVTPGMVAGMFHREGLSRGGRQMRQGSWSPWELEQLRAYRAEGKTLKEIAPLMSRSFSSLQNAVEHYDNMTLDPDIRADILRRTLDANRAKGGEKTQEYWRKYREEKARTKMLDTQERTRLVALAPPTPSRPPPPNVPITLPQRAISPTPHDNPSGCKFPIGELTDKNFRRCGHARLPGRSYCSIHCRHLRIPVGLFSDAPRVDLELTQAAE